MYDLTQSSLALFSISAYGVIDQSMAAEMLQAQGMCVKNHLNGITRMKNATKSVAKKVNHFLTKAKYKLKKSTIKNTIVTTAANEKPACMQSYDNDIVTVHNQRIDSNNFNEMDLNQTSTSSLHFIESSPFAVDECEWKMAEDNYDIVAINDSCTDCSDRYLSLNQLNPMLNQSNCDKSSYGSLDDCISSDDTVSLVSLIINRAQSRSPILFRPDFYIQKSSLTPEASNGDRRHRHQHHTLYQVSNDYCTSSEFEDHGNLIKRINSKQLIESNGIDSTNLNANNNAKNQHQLSQIIEKLAFPFSFELSANITNVVQKFLNYVSIIQ